ncbi:MAG: T9SS C-terminal target domain-containing protein [Desulfobacteraceae bacterium]|nr:MAG: T9SS C-terminal target domain-containing protein [Desulfobacteraceae bacterium]
MGDVFFYQNTGTAQNPRFDYVTANYLTLDYGDDDSMQLVDIDADGDRDLFVGASDEIRFFRNTGTAQSPAFTLEEEYYQGISLESIAPWFCDIDADGDYDLFCGMGAIPGPPGLYLFLNQGTPQAPFYTLYSADLVPGDYHVMLSPTLADIDADGDADLFLTDGDNITGANNIWFYQNLGTPTSFSFGTAVINWQNIDLQAPIWRHLRFFDWDEDGDLDLFLNHNWTEGGENLRYYRNVGTPQNPVMQWVTNAFLPFEVPMPCPGFCDIDADGRTDLFVGDMYGGILFFHGTDTTSVSPYTRPHLQRVIDLSLSPQPGNPFTSISFQLPYAQEVDLAVYNLLGARVASIASGRMNAGNYSLPWASDGYASGIYFVRLATPTETLTRKLTVMK